MASRGGSTGSVALATRGNGTSDAGQALSTHCRTGTTPPADVDAALRALPSHGWRLGWTGRRDRALLVLSQMGGLTYQSIAELTVGDISIDAGVAIVRTPGGTTTLRRADDVVICGPCALARWIHAIDLTALYPSGQVAAAIIARAAPLTSRSPHLCESRLEVAGATRLMPVIPTTDAWGPHPLPAASEPVRAGETIRPTREARVSRKAIDAGFPAPDTSTGRDSGPRAAPFGPLTAVPAQRSQPAPEKRSPRLSLRLSRYPSAGAPAANCDPSDHLEERVLRLLGQSAGPTR